MTGAEFGGVDIDLLADYIGGALTGTPGESAVAARIAGDPDWQAAYSSLTEDMALMSAELGRFEPEPMPADLAARLDAALNIPPAEHNPTTRFDATALPTPPAELSPTARPTFLDQIAAGVDPELAAAETTEPWAVEPRTTELGPAQPRTKLGAAEPRTTELGAAEPRTTEARTTEPGTTEARTTEPGTTEARTTEPGTTEARTTEPGTTEARATEPRTAQPGATQPGATGDSEAGSVEHARRPVRHLALVGDGGAEGDEENLVREEAPEGRRGRRLRWAAPIAVAAGLVAFVGFGLDYLAGRSGPSESDSSSSAGSAEKRADAPLIARSPLRSAQLLASGTDYTRATLGVAPAGTLNAPFASSGGSALVPKEPGAVAGSGSPLQRLTVASALNACLDAIEQENANGALSVESVDFARFSGAPAVVVRFTAANGRWAWASGADCGTPAGDAATLDKVPVG